MQQIVIIWTREVKMKVCVASLFLCTTLITTAIAQGDEQSYYSRRYDSIDVNTIFRSSRLLNNYVDCLLDKKPCPPEGKDLKSKCHRKWLESFVCCILNHSQSAKSTQKFFLCKCFVWLDIHGKCRPMNAMQTQVSQLMSVKKSPLTSSKFDLRSNSIVDAFLASLADRGRLFVDFVTRSSRVSIILVQQLLSLSLSWNLLKMKLWSS